uniref:ABC transmembrane type-1 domain-containing protein n=1 Tax=Panagrellus redivivus TaxID=6233 RepID=A0A7E4VR34_PANRE
MILYLLANNSLCREYAIFNKELTAHINDGSIIDLSIIKSFQSQLIDYLRLACYLNNISNAIVNLTFMAGIMTQIAAQFALYSFSTHMSTAQNMTETKHHIWLDQGIWSKCSNPEVHTVARNIVDRIATVDYASKGMTSTRAGNYLFNAVLIVIPFFVDILGGYKYIDSTVPAH